MPSVFRSRNRWRVQINALPGRPGRSFRWQKDAVEFERKVKEALDRGDYRRVEMLVRPQGEETIHSLVEAWLMTGKPSRTPKQTQLKKTRLLDAIEAMGVASPQDLTLDSATSYIHTRKEREAPKTTNERVAALRSFSHWLFHTGRIDRDTLTLLQRVDSIPTYTRAALSLDDVVGVMASAKVRSMTERLRSQPLTSEKTMADIVHRAEQRELLVALCFAAGMRVDEVRRTTWADVHFEDNEITLDANRVKTRRHEQVFLAPWLSQALINWREKIRRLGAPPHPGQPVIRVPVNVQVRVRRDAAYYGLDIDNPKAKVDLHCLRHSLATWLTEQNVEPHLADLFTRHAPQGSTRTQRYLRRRPEKMHEIAGLIPDLFQLMQEVVGTAYDDTERPCLRLLRRAPKPQRGSDSQTGSS